MKVLVLMFLAFVGPFAFLFAIIFIPIFLVVCFLGGAGDAGFTSDYFNLYSSHYDEKDNPNFHEKY